MVPGVRPLLSIFNISNMCPLFILVWLESLILLTFSKNQPLFFLFFFNFLSWSPVFNFIDFCLLSIFSIYFGLNFSTFSSFLSWKLILLIFRFSPFLIYTSMTVNFLLALLLLHTTNLDRVWTLFLNTLLKKIRIIQTQ